MRLFVTAPCGHKVQIKSEARTRSELPHWFTVACPIDRATRYYTPYEVVAEPDTGHAGAGLVLGGLLGLLGGPSGAVIGATAGAALGAGAGKSDEEATRRFNAS